MEIKMCTTYALQLETTKQDYACQYNGESGRVKETAYHHFRPLSVFGGKEKARRSADQPREKYALEGKEQKCLVLRRRWSKLTAEMYIMHASDRELTQCPEKG